MSDINANMIEQCPDDAVLLDIGANHGIYTVRMADKPSSTDHRIGPAAVRQGATHYFALPGDFDLLRRTLVAPQPRG